MVVGAAAIMALEASPEVSMLRRLSIDISYGTGNDPIPQACGQVFQRDAHAGAAVDQVTGLGAARRERMVYVLRNTLSGERRSHGAFEHLASNYQQSRIQFLRLRRELKRACFGPALA